MHTFNSFRITTDSGDVIFCWSERDKGWLLGGYFYGYIILQIFGGSLAEKFGSKIVLGVSTIICSILTLIIPIASMENIWLVFAIRVCQGLAAGVTFPSLPPMITR
jgi:MFS family permease